MIDEIEMMPHEVSGIRLRLAFTVIYDMSVQFGRDIRRPGRKDAFKKIISITALPARLMITVHLIMASEIITVHFSQVQLVIKEFPVFCRCTGRRLRGTCSNHSPRIQQPVQPHPGSFLVHLYSSALIIQTDRQP